MKPNEKPATSYIVRVYQDGNEMCALIGNDLQEGIAGFGKTAGNSLRALADELDSGKELIFNADGSWYAKDNRTCYVTAMPEEQRGYAWVREKPPFSGAFTVAFITKSEAEKKFGERLIHWIPEDKK